MPRADKVLFSIAAKAPERFHERLDASFCLRDQDILAERGNGPPGAGSGSGPRGLWTRGRSAYCYGSKGDGGTVFATSGGSRSEKDPVPPPMFTVTPEHYNRIGRLIEKKIPVKAEVNIKAEFVEAVDGFNVIAEIPGAGKADEVVIVGAHLDSWHGATGATDNAAAARRRWRRFEL